jgi:hypothetical protein
MVTRCAEQDTAHIKVHIQTLQSNDSSNSMSYSVPNVPQERNK